jgi:hypothetical protein
MHRKDLERRIERFVNTNAYSVIRQDDVEAGKRAWVVQVNKRPPLIRWGALIGECLFNFRSALDHLAYDLAVAYSAPLSPQAESDSEFPIFVDRAPTKTELKRKIGAVHPKARNLIETMQPYGRTDRAALKYLHLLHNFDKHGTLHLVQGVSIGIIHWGERDPDFEHIVFRSFIDGGILARAPLTSASEHDDDPDFMFGVAFSETGPGASAPDVATTLSWIGQHIERGVITPLLPYL